MSISMSSTQVTRPSEKDQTFLPELKSPFHNLPQIARDFSRTYHELALTSSTQFLPTPITTLPDGKERGKFLALDLGGSNLRVGVVELFGDNSGHSAASSDVKAENLAGSSGLGTSSPSSSTHSLSLVTEPERFRITPSSTWSIPEHLKSKEAEALFDWVGECITSVIKTYLSQYSESQAKEIIHQGLPLGVTFSFPMVQSSHTSALLMPMGKGFTFSTTNDLATLLTNAYARQRSLSKEAGLLLPKIEVKAITNDSISTLLAGGYVHKGNATVGIIAGTGTNATCLCPMEKLGDSKKPIQTKDATHVLLNTEWSINGTLPPVENFVTKWDKILDEANEKPGFQPLEEMTGGRYLGELVRLVSMDVLSKDNKRGLPEKFYKPYAIETRICADVEGASQPNEVIQILNRYFPDSGSWEWTYSSANTFKSICQTVSNRAAALIVAATVGILCVNDDLGLRSTSSESDNVQEEEKGESLIISFTGTILEKYPGFRERCQLYFDQVVEQLYLDHEKTGIKSCQNRRRKKRVRLVEAKDGGILGAAVLAGMVKLGKT